MDSRKHVIVANRDILPSMVEELREKFNVTVTSDPLTSDKDVFTQALETAHGLICSMIKIDKGQIEHARNLEAIASVSVGYDNYDLPYLTERRILLTNTPDVLTEATADTGFALIMATARRVVELDDLTRKGLWKRNIDPTHFGTNVYGKKLGIIGFGRIGQAVARRGYFGFGMEILYNSTSSRTEEAKPLNAHSCGFHELLSQADIICVTVPLTPKTKHLIGEKEFALMKPGAIFVNIARGPVVDEQALINALQEGKIQAGLDVFEKEPLAADSPLIQLSNVVLTPHIGSATHETRRDMANLAIRNLRVALEGDRPPNLVNEEAWTRACY